MKYKASFKSTTSYVQILHLMAIICKIFLIFFFFKTHYNHIHDFYFNQGKRGQKKKEEQMEALIT